VFLAWIGWRQDAAAYAAAMAVCLAAALFGKLALAACGGNHPVFGMESPSGHAAFAATFYGCLALVFGTGRGFGQRFALYTLAAGLIVLIGVSRIALVAHTVPEVVVGASIGGMSIALFNVLRGKPERLEFSSRTAVQMSPFAVLYALCFLLLADHWTAEPLIDSIAKWVGAGMHICR